MKGLDPKEYIIVKGGRQHNLKNVDVAVPKGKLVVITGLSGSGKSSLAIDTIYAEGQRKYVESLSSYARQFVGRMDKPEVDSIQGLTPSIAIEQKTQSSNPRSTVGTSTQIYDYFKLLFARIGLTISPKTNQPIVRYNVSDVIHFIKKQPEGAKGLILLKIKQEGKRTLLLENYIQNGFMRLFADGEIIKISDYLEKKRRSSKELFVVIERFVVHGGDDSMNNLSDSIATAFNEGNGYCSVHIEGKTHTFSHFFEEDGIIYEEPSVNLFSFNNSYGACKRCEGFGTIIGIDENLVVPDKSKSIYEGAVVAWRGEKMSKYYDEMVYSANRSQFPIHEPYCDLSLRHKQDLWQGTAYFTGINPFFQMVEQNNYKIQYRVFASRFKGKTDCSECMGTKLRKEANYIKIKGYSITDFVLMPVSELKAVFENLEFSAYEKEVAKHIIPAIMFRLEAMQNLGLDYLTLNRLSRTLSGGETQRIKLTSLIGESIVGASYILDEPSIGLHSRDTHNLIKVLKQLRDKGNTIVVVEHDEEIIRNADYIIDLGPEAGYKGGEIMFQGHPKNICSTTDSLTAKYMNKELAISRQPNRSSPKNFLRIFGVVKHNLKNISFNIPLNQLTVLCGVSGSGKTTLVREIYRRLSRKAHFNLNGNDDTKIEIDGGIEAVEFIDQQAIGVSSRSNVATYTKLWDSIRELMCAQPMSKNLKLSPSSFSFNIEGGRCETCKGDGRIEIEMQFLSNIYLTCDACRGKRFKDYILDVVYKDKNISQILDMTIDEAIDFFDADDNKSKKIADKLTILQNVGLGYIKIGQSSDTFSGGEAQRLKLSTFLTKGVGTKKTFFIFDEPTTGLHFHDVQKLLLSLNALIEKGHSVLLIEHHLDVIRNADHVIELGPEGGEQGGRIVFEGTPQTLEKQDDTPTGKFLCETVLI